MNIITLLASLLLTAPALAASAKPENVTAVWSGGSIVVSWDAPEFLQDIVRIQRRLDGSKDATWEVIGPKLGVIQATVSTPMRNCIQDDQVAVNVGEYSYRVAFGGKGGPWSRFAYETNKPVPDLQSLTQAKTMLPVPLTRREGRVDAKARKVVAQPVPPAPFLPKAPFAPTITSVEVRPNGILITWRTVEPMSEFDIQRTAAGTGETFRISLGTPSSVGSWLDLNATTGAYRVRSLSTTTGDTSPWSAEVPVSK